MQQYTRQLAQVFTEECQQQKHGSECPVIIRDAALTYIEDFGCNVLLEHAIRGNFQKFNSNSGWISGEGLHCYALFFLVFPLAAPLMLTELRLERRACRSDLGRFLTLDVARVKGGSTGVQSAGGAWGARQPSTFCVLPRSARALPLTSGMLPQEARVSQGSSAITTCLPTQQSTAAASLMGSTIWELQGSVLQPTLMRRRRPALTSVIAGSQDRRFLCIS